MYIKFAKMHEYAYTPERANPSDAGMDIRVPNLDELQFLKLMPNTSTIIPTGLKFEVPHGYMLEVKNRSSVAAKKHLIVGACVIDSGYAGEVFINLHNIGATPRTIMAGDKIAQVVVVPVVPAFLVETTEEDLYQNEVTVSNRGDGALGSTDK